MPGEKRVYPEHFVTWAISLSTLIALLFGGVKVIYGAGQSNAALIAQIAALQTTVSSIDKRLSNLETVSAKRP
jgi:hypothetical protein